MIKDNRLTIGISNHDKFLEKHHINLLNFSHLFKETSINTSLMLISKKLSKIQILKLMRIQKHCKFKESQNKIILEP